MFISAVLIKTPVLIYISENNVSHTIAGKNAEATHFHERFCIQKSVEGN